LKVSLLRPAATIGEASLMLCEAVSLNFFLSVVGLKLEPVNKMIVKQVDNSALLPCLKCFAP
jgi:hypothetical protein